MADFSVQRKSMVERQLAARGIKNQAVLEAMRTVPREMFVEENLKHRSYGDSPISIGEGQTISQPYVVALMLQALLESLPVSPYDAKVLEVGVGSGYSAAVLSRTVKEVYGIERYKSLYERAKVLLEKLDYKNISLKLGDGTLGWVEAAPYHGIIVTAGGPKAPESLLNQLVIGGQLIMPIGLQPREQELVRITRLNEIEYQQKNLASVYFVPLVGKEGWGSEANHTS